MAQEIAKSSVATATQDKRKEMLAKSAATRKARSEQISKLDDKGRYALKCILTAKNNLAMAEDLILSGKVVTSEFIQVLGNVQSATGEMLS